ncbi:thiamine phosphate synthase [Aneurinibacillus thermoaerophilus]|uniref:thiamine phosphate synthase n=1 Tax=Aneurinibacillus thermoaerophilus TaxID=143495 RepID=UPI002E207994|nr:thiamine phosphate synthase [Aneurinibacillus thermoaerophilus]MED0678305.1 thiamine phosphate synthase [Aneurinibacillus thermoaerophilus]MED0736169.1 thiamine phosphate synthase [Aneurinibacillus thermoaerophilus]MED0765818.1 thiamine phosphate synthase [Aneurinibacillus thermoaerophilus]
MNPEAWQERLGVYLVLGIDNAGGCSALETVRLAIEGGVDVVQLREKKAPLRRVLEVGRKMRELCREHDVLFVVNDRVDVAMLLDADGVHVGQDDLPAGEARKLIGDHMFIGVSASSVAEARWAIEQGADYLGVGAIYATGSKADAGDPVTPALIGEIRKFSALPIVGIGGITAENCAEVMEQGANGVAVISAIVGQPDPKQATVRLKQAVAPFIGK